jgi:hypothetical protein
LAVRAICLAAVFVAAAAIMCSPEPALAAHVAPARGLALELGGAQREVLPGRPVLRAMFRVRQPDGSLDPPPPVAMIALSVAFSLARDGTNGEGTSLCPPAGTSSVGYCPRGPPPRGRATPSSLERA